jgi:hypothetical protein
MTFEYNYLISLKFYIFQIIKRIFFQIKISHVRIHINSIDGGIKEFELYQVNLRLLYQNV